MISKFSGFLVTNVLDFFIYELPVIYILKSNYWNSLVFIIGYFQIRAKRTCNYEVLFHPYCIKQRFIIPFFREVPN